MAGKREQVLESLRHAVPSFWVMFAWGIGAIVLIWLVVRMRGWFRDESDPAAEQNDLLGELRELNQRGDLTDSEFRLIKSRMVESVQRTSKTYTGLSKPQAGSAVSAVSAELRPKRGPSLPPEEAIPPTEPVANDDPELPEK